MLFNSFSFMIFFPIVLLVYFVIPKKTRYIWLLVASYYFYMSWNPKYAILIAGSTLVTYCCGLFLEKFNDSNSKRIILLFSLFINLGILTVFKYSDFVTDSINRVLSLFSNYQLTNRFDFLLPVGISFYTFQALGYTLDVYRGDIKAERNLIRYALFVSFFPQLVAGPIERSKNLITQIGNIQDIMLWNYERITSGAILMLWGLFQKMVIADRIAVLVDRVYGEYWIFGSTELIIASVLFAVQIYCDFASYSLIAIGSARIMGFELMENFNTPYMAISVKDFWRRWHISLSTWFRDYLYIPLGGSHCSKGRYYFNVLITFLVSGLWHGANWTYVIWGGLHGVYQIIETLIQPIKEKLYAKFDSKTDTFSFKFGRMIITFICVDFAWIFFRADTVSDALCIVNRIFTRYNPWVLFNGSLYNYGLDATEIHILAIAMILLVLVDIVKFIHNETIDVFLSKQCIWFRWVSIIFVLMFVVICGVYGPEFDAKQFIYFQF